jgi:hypothetical protein
MKLCFNSFLHSLTDSSSIHENTLMDGSILKWSAQSMSDWDYTHHLSTYRVCGHIPISLH